MRTRNFRARNETVAGGAVTESHKGEKANTDRKVGECYQWKAFGQCSMEDSCSFRHDPASGNGCAGRQERQSSSPAPKAKAQTEGKIQSKGQVVEGRAHPEQEAEFRPEIPSEESVRLRHEKFGTLPCVSTTSLNVDANVATDVDSDTLGLMCSPIGSRRKVVRTVAL